MVLSPLLFTVAGKIHEKPECGTNGDTAVLACYKSGNRDDAAYLKQFHGRTTVPTQTLKTNTTMTHARKVKVTVTNWAVAMWKTQPAPAVYNRPTAPFSGGRVVSFCLKSVLVSRKPGRNETSNTCSFSKTCHNAVTAANKTAFVSAIRPINRSRKTTATNPANRYTRPATAP